MQESLRRLGPYGKPLTRSDGPYGKGRSLTGRAGVPYGSFTEKDNPYRRPFTRRDGPYEKGRKSGPLQEAPYGEGRSLREGPVLTGGSLTGMAPFPKKDDKEAYWKAERLREAPNGEGRSLREGPVLTGIYRGPYGQTALREGPLRITGKLTGTLTGRASYGEGRSLQEGPHEKGKSLTGKSPYKGRS